MCGIAGIVSLDGSPVTGEELRSMCAVLHHRGPDEQGFYCNDGIGLGMRRLSIIDLSTGQQPIANEDQTVWAILNGEIYNYQELRHELMARGHRFKSESDTETIVHLYEEHGERCVDRLRGMFALAVWDVRRRRLFLARDRLGIKPLYYTTVGGRLAFASEAKALLALPEVERSIDQRSLVYLLTFLTTPHQHSFVRGIHKLEAAHWLSVGVGRPLRSERYWDVEFAPNRRRPVGDTAAELWALLKESVQMHMLADVPLGAFLSGGVDSSAVVAAMAQASSRPVRTFSIGFDEADFDELSYARLVAERFSTEHHELVVRPDAASILGELAWYLDEPFGDSSAIPTFMVSKLAAEHVTVALSGDGGDELFAGYDKYAVEGRQRRVHVPAPMRKWLAAVAERLPVRTRGRGFLRHHALSGAERYFDSCTLFRRDTLQRLLHPDLAAGLPIEEPWHIENELFGRAKHWLSSLQYLDLRSYLPLDILTKVDRMSMAHSLEARVPLLDHRLVEFAATIPPEQLLRGRRRKWMFKRALEGILPPAVLERPKRGFAVPLGRWFRGDLRGVVRELLLSEQTRRRGLFSAPAVAELVSMHDAGRPLDLQLWTLMSVELWCRAFLDGGRIAAVARQRDVA